MAEFLGLFSLTVCVCVPDLLRRQEELRRMEEAHNQEVQKRKQMELRQEEERRRRDEELRAHTEELMRRQQGTGANFAEKVHTHTRALSFSHICMNRAMISPSVFVTSWCG